MYGPAPCECLCNIAVLGLGAEWKAGRKELRHNKIGAEGATALAGALRQCTNLQHLNLGGNKIGDEGAIALAEALPQCPALQHLNLECKGPLKVLRGQKKGARGKGACAETTRLLWQ
eukprot:scaffold95764_cov32-Prasinocladus_malaysianus.AAC.2